MVKLVGLVALASGVAALGGVLAGMGLAAHIEAEIRAETKDGLRPVTTW